MAKIYLSPAAHLHDNSTKCPTKCGENVHCNQYMDIVERRLKELGFEIHRERTGLTGSKAIDAKVKDANEWKADLYYVSHTNAGGGRYSKTFHYGTAESKKWVEIFHKYRQPIINHKMAVNRQLSEIRRPNMITLYDELFFHDNAEDCKWFHNGGMEKIAESTVHAICDIFGVKYQEEKKPEPTPTPTPAPTDDHKFRIGDLIALTADAVYDTGKAIPAWVKAKKWYIASIVGERAVLGKSEDGKNNINSPVNVKYLVATTKTETKTDTKTDTKPATPATPTVEKAPVITYQAHTGGIFGKWWGKIVGDSDYAGVKGKAITAIKASTDIGVVKVRVHTVRGKYYAWVANNDAKQGGYAGVYGKNIDTIQMTYNGKDGYVVEYRVAPVGGNYLPWVRDYNDKNDAGYAGIYGKPIDRIQMRIVKK